MGRGCRACQGASGFLRRLLLNARATADDGSKLTVSFPAGSTFAIKMLGRADTQSVVLPTVCAVFGRRTVDYVLDGGGTPAPQHEEHSPSARAAVSADPQPVSSAAPVSSSASATQPKAAPVAAPTLSAPKPAAPKPAAPAPAPKPAAAPAPKSSDLAKAPWLRSDNPAGAPATGKLPTEPAPRAPERASAPKAQPAAPSAPWESEQVPYDDVMVGGFAADAGGDDLPRSTCRVRRPRPSPLQLPPKRRTLLRLPGSPTPARAAPSAIKAQPQASRRPRTRPKPHPQRLRPVHHLQTGGVAVRAGILLKKRTPCPGASVFRTCVVWCRVYRIRADKRVTVGLGC